MRLSRPAVHGILSARVAPGSGAELAYEVALLPARRRKVGQSRRRLPFRCVRPDRYGFGHHPAGAGASESFENPLLRLRVAAPEKVGLIPGYGEAGGGHARISDGYD